MPVNVCDCGHDPLGHTVEHGCAYCKCDLGLYAACEAANKRGIRILVWGHP